MDDTEKCEAVMNSQWKEGGVNRRSQQDVTEEGKENID
jgi:hypothetical protein